MNRIAKGAGKVVPARHHGLSGIGWGAVMDTEYAALKVYYMYARSGSKMRLKKQSKGWSVSLVK